MPTGPLVEHTARYNETVPDQTPSEPWVAVLADNDAATGLLDTLRQAGTPAHQIDSRTDLMQQHLSHAPQAVVLALGSVSADLAATGRTPLAHWDVPIIAIGPAGRPDSAELVAHMTHSDVHHWQSDLAPADWPHSLAFARAVHRRDQARRQRIATLQDQLAEQRLVARAKGLLMAAQTMTEGEAFALLRSGAMQTRLPLADMARAVVDAAVWAAAVNRAGQLRWLSQRCIAAAAQRLARIDPPAARKAQQEAMRRARDILEELGRLPLSQPLRDALGAADAAWAGLKTCLDLRLNLPSLSAADAAADIALGCAEVLTGALQAAGSSPMLRVVNLCGRQRMRAQRLVKLGLLTQLGMAPSDSTEAAALMEGFGNTLRELERLPLGSDEIAAAHRLAADRWRDMCQALQSGSPADLVPRGEALLDGVDALTHCWERSLQLLLE